MPVQLQSGKGLLTRLHVERTILVDTMRGGWAQLHCAVKGWGGFRQQVDTGVISFRITFQYL